MEADLFSGPIKPMSQQKKTVKKPMSDLQRMLEEERKQHQQTWEYENGDGMKQVAGWRSSF